MTSRRCVIVVLVFLTIFLYVGCMLVGSVDIPAGEVFSSMFTGEASRAAWRYIVVETRFPAACTALIAGASLAVAGLLLQTLFDNPLAGPSILGISTGSSLGVAVVMLWVGASVAFWGQAAVLLAAFAGAAVVMAVLVSLSSLIKSHTMLLIAGILIGYLASSVIALLNFFASGESVHSYVVWGLGTFNSVTLSQLPWISLLALLFIVSGCMYAKPLNALLLGERYASSVGVNVRSVRNGIMLVSGALTAVVTAWCGPIGFIGLVVPHITRLALKSSNHRILVPATALCGAAVGLLCQFVSVLPGKWGIIPINAITPVIGVPIIIYIIVKRRSIAYFN